MRAVVLLSFVRLSRGGSRSSGVGSFSPVGCVSRVSVPRGRLSSPFRANETTSPKARSQRQLALRCRYALKACKAGNQPRRPSVASSCSPVASDSVREVVARHRRTRDPWPAPRQTAPDSTAFHFVPLRSANGRPRAHAQPPPRRRSQRRRRHCPGARHEASLTLRYVPLRENRRDSRQPPRRESGQLLLRLRFSCVRGCASAELPALTTAPNVSRTSGRPCSALGLSACPATPKPRPGATHSRPEVRTARPPRPVRTATPPVTIRFVRGVSWRMLPTPSHKSCYL